jgi:hypothetical protein
VPSTSRWAFYTPSLTSVDLAAYATEKNYDVLTTINGGEGFWVNAKTVFSIQSLIGTAISSTSFADRLTGTNNLPSGWSLIAVGDNPSPRSFVNTIALAQPSAPNVVVNSLATLWAWSSSASNWYFYAPIQDNTAGVLESYITSKSYLDFTVNHKTLDPTTGFWVSHP